MDKKITFTLDRLEALRVIQATVHVMLDFKHEIQGENTTADRRRACESSKAMWERIMNELDKQFDEQDQ